MASETRRTTPERHERGDEESYLGRVVAMIDEAAISPVDLRDRAHTGPRRYVDDVIAMIDAALVSAKAPSVGLEELASEQAS